MNTAESVAVVAMTAKNSVMATGLTAAMAPSAMRGVEGGAVRGRYSIIGLKPDLIWRCRGSAAEINRNARFEPEKFTAETLPALENEDNIGTYITIPIINMRFQSFGVEVSFCF